MNISDKSSVASMTWLEAAEYVLSLEGPEMHIRDLTDRIMRLNMVNSSCKTSLETLLYRQTHKINSKFQRVPGKMGWFKLKDSSTTGLCPDLVSGLSMSDQPIPKAIVVKARGQKHRRASPQSDQSGSSNSSSEGESSDEELYHKRYSYLKSLAKRLIMDNVALALQLEDIQRDIEKAQSDKKFLLERLLDAESREATAVKKPSKGKAPPTAIASTVSKTTGRSRKSTEPVKMTRPPAKLPPSSPKQVNDSIEMSNSSSSSDSEEESVSKRVKSVESKPSSTDGVGRKKRVRRVQPVPLKEDGTPVLPIRIGGLQVHSLGKVIWERPAFHSERYIWPVGFESTRTYPSMVDPSKRCTYVCRIVDGGEAPIFEMASEESPNQPIQATSATACHHAVLKAINEARDKQATNAGSGPEFFGFSHPTIMNLIQAMDGAEKCTKYKKADFQLSASRGKQLSSLAKGSRGKKSLGSSKTHSNAFYKSGKLPDSQLGDPSLAPVVINRQLSNLLPDLSSDSSSSDCSEHDLVIDTMVS